MPSVRPLFAALLLLGACGGRSEAQAATPAAASASAGSEVRLNIQTSANSNNGTALQVLVRETNKVDYPRSNYQEVANSLLAEADPKALDWFVVLPGQNRVETVKRPKQGALAVYFLFTNPGRRWRYLLDNQSAQQIEFLIGRDQITQARVVGAKAGSS